MKQKKEEKNPTIDAAAFCLVRVTSTTTTTTTIIIIIIIIIITVVEENVKSGDVTVFVSRRSVPSRSSTAADHL